MVFCIPYGPAIPRAARPSWGGDITGYLGRLLVNAMLSPSSEEFTPAGVPVRRISSVQILRSRAETFNVNRGMREPRPLLLKFVMGHSLVSGPVVRPDTTGPWRPRSWSSSSVGLQGSQPATRSKTASGSGGGDEYCVPFFSLLRACPRFCVFGVYSVLSVRGTVDKRS